MWSAAQRHDPQPVFESVAKGSGREGFTEMPNDSVRVILYSHDAMGIGHVRRNLRIAQALTTSGVRGRAADVLLMSGVVEAASFELPPHVDCLTLPALRKAENGRYVPRRLGLAADAMTTLRSATIASAVQAFAPDAVIVDKLPHGVAGELVPTIQALQRSRAAGRCRLVLGLRDVLDDPQVVHVEWDRDQTVRWIEESFDAVWIYGDTRVFDTVREYRFSPAVAAKTHYTGYLHGNAASSGASAAELAEKLDLRGRQVVLCMVGGGEDGAPLATAFARGQMPGDAIAVIVTGPFMPPESKRELRALASRNARLRVIEFVAESAALLSLADRVVAMGGYNTMCEILAAGKAALIVPRVEPRREQWIRAARLNEMGMISVVDPCAIGSHEIEQWLALPNPPTASVEGKIDFDGLSRIPEFLGELLLANESSSGGRTLVAVSLNAARRREAHVV
jgi:predicted glycosyltransferase